MKRFFQSYFKTFKDIAANSSLLTTLILSVFMYSFFYPTAYQAQQAQALPIIIVDEEQSAVTSAIIGQVAKSPNVEIKAETGNFAEAERIIHHQQDDGILLLPENLTRAGALVAVAAGSAGVCLRARQRGAALRGRRMGRSA